MYNFLGHPVHVQVAYIPNVTNLYFFLVLFILYIFERLDINKCPQLMLFMTLTRNEGLINIQ